MLLSAFDPALLIYQHEHWQNRQPHFFSRIKALTQHRRFIKKYNQQIAMSEEFAGFVYQSFPWNGNFKSIGELRDLRQFILEELSRVRYIAKAGEAEEVSLQPDGLTCEYVGIPTILDVWKELLCACVEGESNSEFDVQVATWETPAYPEHPPTIIVTINSATGSEDYHLPLVWDEDGWVIRLASQDSWPDLRKCVEFYFMANPGMQNYYGVRGQPIPFECTDGFWKSVDDYCQPNMRHLLVKAIAKKVYGILDASLHDEPLGQIRRFRVTTFWRVHYYELDDRLVLEEFGEHNMGL